MARWPDPILRRQAQPVDYSSGSFTPSQLLRACRLLKQTSLAVDAVGLAAQQCGIDARIVYLRLGKHDDDNDITLINPRIVQRSPEQDMRVWTESCLVLPPTFTATVLRDAAVEVAYQDVHGTQHTMRVRGEVARALQHEMDHDRGILVTDHVDLSELENDVMRTIEEPGHDQRMKRAYDRYY